MNKFITSLYLILITIFLADTLPLFSQKSALGKITISSPNAASLGKFGDVPVSNHTGIPDISIPIYTIKSGTLEVPITLNYHASGLKVQEQASWVGAGWSLNSGGVITRTVVGAPDDRGVNASTTDKGHFSDYGYSSYIFSPGNTTCDPNPNGNGPAYCPTGTTYAPQDSYLQSGKFDGEPDLYFFNFNGHSGKFYFNDDRTPILVPEQDYKIVPIFTSLDSRGITGFIITTNDGIQYYFGQNPETDGNIDALELTYNASTQSPYTGQGSTSAWYLNKVVSADGQFVIHLIYQAENYSYYGLAMYPIPSVRNPNFFAYNLEYDLNKNFINGVRLSKISFPNGEVDFNAGSLRQDMAFGTNYSDIVDVSNSDNVLGAKALGSISILSSSFCKQYKFYTSYFYDGTALTGDLFTLTYPNLNLQSDKYRLRLDSIQESTCDNAIKIPPYKFDYFPGTVPRKLSFGIDHWGFYNGVTTNNGLIPTYTIISPTNQVTVKPGADRDSHWPNSLNGSLKKITYPTAGSSNFDFESNSIFNTSTSTSKFPLVDMPVGVDGQSSAPRTSSFTSTAGALYLSFTKASSYSATFSIKNSVGTVVYNVNITQDGLWEPVINLTPDTYQATLSLTGSGTGGIDAKISEYRTVQNTSNVEVGGIRIKTITNSDGISTTDMVTSYNYNFDNNPTGQSSGILYSRPIYVQAIRNDVWATVNGGSCSQIGCILCFGSDASYYQSPSSIRPMSSVQGNHIGYGEVYVSKTGNGYDHFRYYSSGGGFAHVYDTPPTDVCIRTLSTFCDPNIPNSPAPPVPFDPLRGELAYHESVSQSGQTIQTNTYYPSFQMDPLTTPGIISKLFVTGYAQPGNPNPDPLSADPFLTVQNGVVPIGLNTFTEYFLQSAKRIKDSVVTVTYDPASGNHHTVINATYYGSTYHNSPTQTLSISSKGEKLVTNYTNAFDYRISNFNVTDQLSTYSNNIINDQSYLSSALASIMLSPSDAHYYWQRLNYFTNYRYKKYTDRQTFIEYRKQNFTNASNAYATAHNNAKSAADANLKPIFQLQDEYINAPIEISEWRNNSLLNATFNRYDYTENPPGYVYPQSRELLSLAAPSPSFTSSSVSNNSLIKDGRYLTEDTYTFSKGRMVQINPKNGVSTSYLYGYNNSFPVAEVVGSNYQTISGLVNQTILDNASGQYSDQDVNAQLTSLRTGLNGTKAQVSSYTYNPLIGMTSQSNARNMQTYDEYDKLGRLHYIKDLNKYILKSFEYNYGNNSCGSNCYLIDLKTFTEYKTPGYPVGVFSVNRDYLGIANNATEYALLWNGNAANTALGTLMTTDNSLRFSLTVVTGATAPNQLYGLRFYQFDSNAPSSISLETDYLSVVDWGDGNRQLITGDRWVCEAYNLYAYAAIPQNHEFGYYYVLVSHQYSNVQARTVTVFHNETTEDVTINNADGSMANDATDNINIRGNYPEMVKRIAYYGISNSSDVNVLNFQNLTEVMSVGYYFDNSTSTKHNNWQSAGNFHKLKWIKMYFKNGSEILPNLNIYPDLELCDFHEYKPNLGQDLSFFSKMKLIYLLYYQNPYTPTEVDAIITATANGTINQGILRFIPQASKTGASTPAYNTLLSRGWSVQFN